MSGALAGDAIGYFVTARRFSVLTYVTRWLSSGGQEWAECVT